MNRQGRVLKLETKITGYEWKGMMMGNVWMQRGKDARTTFYRCHFFLLSILSIPLSKPPLSNSLRYDRCKFSILESRCQARGRDETRRDETILEIEKKNNSLKKNIFVLVPRDLDSNHHRSSRKSKKRKEKERRGEGGKKKIDYRSHRYKYLLPPCH